MMWHHSDWTYRKKITVPAGNIPIRLDEFPLLVDFTDSDIQTNARSDGFDILFTSGDGFTRIPYERESYASAMGRLLAWVRVPTLWPQRDTEFYVYYRFPASNDQQEANGVWGQDYKAVWHMNEDPGPGGSDEILDSTATDSHGQAEISMTPADLVPGQIGRGIQFDGGDDYISFAINTTEIPNAPNYTISAWVRPLTANAGQSTVFAFATDWPNCCVNQPNDFSYLGMGLGLVPQRPFLYHAADSDDVVNLSASVSIEDFTWHHMVGTRLGDDFSIFIDGQLSTTTTSVVIGQTEPVLMWAGQSPFMGGFQPYLAGRAT